MARKLIIDGNAVYEVDEQCLAQKERKETERRKDGEREERETGSDLDKKKG